MHFVDEVTLTVNAGDGGNGCSAMRREKYIPLGGPAGGDGGKGGDMIFEAHDRFTTLLDLRYRKLLKAQNGENGRGKDQYGKGGEDHVVQVPPGTQVYDDDTGELICDLDKHGERFVVARGGMGGRGNIHFASSVNQAPTKAEPGEPGESRNLRLELKLLADVGLLGFPNVGKSTLIASVSRARPKIADYPFTTLAPNLGVVSMGEERSFVIADIPGIVEGAAEGTGLGLQFLRHVERTRVLLHLITHDPDPEREPVRDFDVLMAELARFDEELGKRPVLVALSKLDLPEVKEAEAGIKAAFEERGMEVLPFSAATREGVDALLQRVEALLAEHPVSGGVGVKQRHFPTAEERPAEHRPHSVPEEE